MGYIDCIYSLDFTRIKAYLHGTFHKVSYGIVREPCIDEDAHIVSVWIQGIDEELSMSEGCDDHRK